MSIKSPDNIFSFGGFPFSGIVIVKKVQYFMEHIQNLPCILVTFTIALTQNLNLLTLKFEHNL